MGPRPRVFGCIDARLGISATAQQDSKLRSATTTSRLRVAAPITRTAWIVARGVTWSALTRQRR
jgi:hypothetical protein